MHRGHGGRRHVRSARIWSGASGQGHNGQPIVNGRAPCSRHPVSIRTSSIGMGVPLRLSSNAPQRGGGVFLGRPGRDATRPGDTFGAPTEGMSRLARVRGCRIWTMMMSRGLTGAPVADRRKVRFMDSAEIAGQRMANQFLGGTKAITPVEVVQRLGAVQAQDYRGGLLAVGMRTADATESLVEAALADRAVVRTWPMRGTLHLLTPRVIARSASRFRQLGLEAADFTRSRKLVEKGLRGSSLSRAELYGLFARGGVSPAGQRGIHILGWLAQKGVICPGPRRGKVHTFVLLDDWLPPAPLLPREEALEKLALCYFRGHGPATDRDFAWWSGLTLSEARAGLDAAASRLQKIELDGEPLWAPPTGRRTMASSDATAETLLLPPFDELLVAYKNRSAAVDKAHEKELHALLSPTIARGGRIVGTWRRKEYKGRVHIAWRSFSKPAREEIRGLQEAAEVYGRFVGAQTVLEEGR
jgi:hypothetical protein